MILDFKHIQAAHCENGVTTSLLRHNGVEKITEPLAFGIGSGLFYIYIPFLKINNGPAISFRTRPGLIFNRTCKALGIPVYRKKFSSPEKAMEALDECIKAGIPAACQVGVYYLTYFPREYRFHFNAHNLIVFGKEEDHYLISDPVMESTAALTSYELQRVRFARGALAPRGQLYYPKEKRIVTDDQIREAIKTGLKRNVRDMLRIPGNIAGIRGIKYTAKKIKGWREKLGLEKSRSYLAQLVRMQEEIGTGGGGFRFIYAAFLQQAYSYIPVDELMEISKQFTHTGDLWRNAAVQAAGIYKGRLSAQQDFNIMGDYLLEIAELEKKAFNDLANIKMDPMSMAVSIKDLSFAYKGQQTKCITHLDLEIAAGERFGIFGPNGAGKTTLMHLMTGLLDYQSGSLRILDHEVRTNKKAIKNLFGFVPQDFSFYHELSPVENLEFFGAWAGLTKYQIRHKINELLSILGLFEVRNTAVQKFSGGMKRRVNLAIGVINEPGILFLDEPTVGVDVQTRYAIINYLKELNAKGTTLVYTSHQLNEAEDLCEKIALIDEGKIIVNDSLDRLLTEHRQQGLEGLFLNLTGKAFRD